MTAKHSHKMISKIFKYKYDDKTSLPYGCSVRYNRDLFPILFAKLGFQYGAEIGVQYGEYSKKLCKANPNLKLLCIDPWLPRGAKYTQERQNEIYQHCIKNLKDYNCTIIKKTSMEALNGVQDKSLDFVYIDGDHTFDYVMEDIIKWNKKIKTGGICAVHDYNYNVDLGVIFAVDAYTRAHNIRPWYVTKEVQPTAFWVVDE